jgi:hypothetical protein
MEDFSYLFTNCLEYAVEITCEKVASEDKKATLLSFMDPG